MLRPARRRASSSMLPARSQPATSAAAQIFDLPVGPTEPPPQPVTTRLPVPGVNFVEAGIVVTSSWPPTVQAGEAFALCVGISNCTAVLQRLQLAVGDTSGFVFAGAPICCCSLSSSQSAVAGVSSCVASTLLVYKLWPALIYQLALKRKRKKKNSR